MATVTGPIHTVINEWEPTRDVLDTKQNKVGTSVISSHDYVVNAIGQRTGAATSGTAYPAVPSWLWSYDALGQVTSADSSFATSDRAYQYDAIGNRIQARNGVTTATGTPNYTANALNQYTSVPSYDFDGNMTSGPLPVSPTTNSTLLWDGENRLTEVKNAAGTILEQNLFDAGSRKIAITANGITTLYLYDAWNCIAEYTRSVGVSPTLQKTRLWGTDLSGTPQGAGGVGGMLSESSPITFNSSYPTYDGNGNVSEYLDSTGQVTAHYEYDPFGNTVVNTDTANQFAYRFSTKPLAFATGLYYYGYRYYDPLTGRWPSRDPIEEKGGENLYSFNFSTPNNFYDYLGLDPQPIPGTNYNRHVHNPNKAAKKGEAVRHPGKDGGDGKGGYDNNCAAGAQHETGTNTHDAPNTSEWERGDPVTEKTPKGTMIAKGWVQDASKSEGYSYPNQPGQSSPNHTAQFEGINKDGSLQARDQSAVGGNGHGKPMDSRNQGTADGWHEVNTKKGCPCPKSKGTSGAPR